MATALKEKFIMFFYKFFLQILDQNKVCHKVKMQIILNFYSFSLQKAGLSGTSAHADNTVQFYSSKKAKQRQKE